MTYRVVIEIHDAGWYFKVVRSDGEVMITYPTLQQAKQYAAHLNAIMLVNR